MKQSLWGSALIVPLAVMSFACGGATFTTGNDAGSSSSGGGSGSSGGSGSGSGGSSGGSGSGSGSSSGGSGSSSGGSGSSSGGSGSSSGGGCLDCVDSGPVSPCPVHQPVAKTSCTPQGLECEYGSNPVQGCDSVSTCNSTWQGQSPTDSNCGATLDSSCPLTFDAALQGSTCSDNGQVCNYARGRCACVSNFGGPVQLVDASVKGRWVCQDPTTPGCPIPRAPLGSLCTQNGLSCDYGTCNVPGGTAQVCQGNIWKPEAVPCPVFAAAQ